MFMNVKTLTSTIFRIGEYLPSATKLRRLCFYTCLSFCSQGGSASVHAGIPPPPSRHPLGADTPRSGTPPNQAPPGSRHPLEHTHPPPPDQEHSPEQATPPPREQRRLLLRTVRILLECILVGYFFNLRIRQSVLFWSLTFQKDC